MLLILFFYKNLISDSMTD